VREIQRDEFWIDRSKVTGARLLRRPLPLGLDGFMFVSHAGIYDGVAIWPNPEPNTPDHLVSYRWPMCEELLGKFR